MGKDIAALASGLCCLSGTGQRTPGRNQQRSALAGLYGRHVVPRLIASAMARDSFAPFRQRIAEAARGHVLEVGIGAGYNLDHYPKAVSAVTGIDRSRELLGLAATRGARSPFPVALIQGSAEQLPVKDESVDTVVSTWVLCSVSDPAAALAELRRVLRPDGMFLFVEHGDSPDRGIAVWQQLLNPLWRRVAGGCNLTRPIDRLIGGAGFELTRLSTGYMEGFRPQGYIYEGQARCPMAGTAVAARSSRA